MNFVQSYNQCLKAGDAIIEGEFSPEYVPLMERSVVISGVTAIEVYFRDILDAMFKYCSPAFFTPKLKSIHPEKYDIDDLLAVYRHNIHPLELVLSGQSFQNIEKIDKVFSKFIDKGLWATVLGLQVRLPEKPEDIVTWNKATLEGLKATFNLRHELVHDPARRAFLSQSIIENMQQSMLMVFGADVVLSTILAENKDPTLADENET